MTQFFTKCENCNDTGWIKHPAGGGHFCQICRQSGSGVPPLVPAADVVAAVARWMESGSGVPPLELEHWPDAAATLQIPWADLDPEEASVVALISQADRQHPVRIADIQTQTGLSDRTVKSIVHTLREVHLLPIGGSRKPPVGMFWIKDAAGFQTYYDQTFAQAMSELRTLHKMARTHYPELAGQMKLPGIESLDH